MPFGTGAKKFERKLATELAWAPGEVVDPNDQVRLPLTALGPPSTASMAESAAVLAAGPPGTRAPSQQLQVHRFTGRTLVLDPVGLRHVEIPRGVTRLSPVKLNFAVRWAELYRIVVELIHNPRMNMTQGRIVMVPPDPGAFRAAHPQMAPMNGAARVGPDAWMLSLGMSYSVDQNVMSGLVYGLGRYAPRLFSGHVDTMNG